MIRRHFIRCALMLALAGMPFSGMAADYYLDPEAREFRFKESDSPYVPAIIRRRGE